MDLENIENKARLLLEQTDVLRQPSDLDLLLFFARHPYTLLSTEQISAFLGYGFKDIASGLDLLLDLGYLSRTPSPKNAARLYVFVIGSSGGGWLPALLRMAGTRHGRMALVGALRQKANRTSTGRSGGAALPGERGTRNSAGTAQMLSFRGRADTAEPSPESFDASRQDRKGAR